jgi:hypothetical protein
MNLGERAYRTWNRGSFYAMAWIGALMAPWAIRTPVREQWFWMCVAGGVAALWCIWDGVDRRLKDPPSDFVARTVVTSSLLGLSLVAVLLVA